MYHDKHKQAIHRDSSRIAAAGPAAFGLGVAGAGAGLGGGHQRTTVFFLVSTSELRICVFLLEVRDGEK